MPRLLLTAFRPFDGWDENASWLALQAVTRDLPTLSNELGLEVTTRLYPVDYEELLPRLASDLTTPYDAVLHVGQATGASAVRLEQFAVNVRRLDGERSDRARPLEANGPAAYQSLFPLGEWVRQLREAGVPAELSFHAGDYLCNATYYWSHHLLRASGIEPRVAFIHLPLDTSQSVIAAQEMPSLATEATAQALRLLLGWAGGASSATDRVVQTVAPEQGTS